MEIPPCTHHVIFRPEILKFHPYSIFNWVKMVGFVIYCVVDLCEHEISLSLFWFLYLFLSSMRNEMKNILFARNRWLAFSLSFLESSGEKKSFLGIGIWVRQYADLEIFLQTAILLDCIFSWENKQTTQQYFRIVSWQEFFSFAPSTP